MKGNLCSKQVNELNTFLPDPGRRAEINLNFHFHTSLSCFKRFYEGRKGTTKKCENKNLS